MPRSSSSPFRPDFKAELRSALGYDAADLGDELRKLIASGRPLPLGLQRAIYFVLSGKDEEFELKLHRRHVGRPSQAPTKAPNPQELERFIQARLEHGELLKNAVVDAMRHFRIGRSTVYRMRQQAKAEERDDEKRQALVRASLKQPGGRHVSRSKRQKCRRKRHNMPKKLRAISRVKLPDGERARAMRLNRLSRKYDDIWD